MLSLKYMFASAKIEQNRFEQKYNIGNKKGSQVSIAWNQARQADEQPTEETMKMMKYKEKAEEKSTVTY